ncbi:MAG: biotin--[acetyl-CoA-carboxylase] ligase [Oscillospiraceae bacterium]|jgi:BirA family biotin operon repressor/biotin-[acetyl-CoA-carboxylase] ligase|nr:biotin--[acetyl-CoA-carboxylase] ligase [Oscillospiraceae bacterium]
MPTKEKILSLLEKNRSRDLSGTELARSLGVTRAAVWKAVRALEREGHLIEAAPNRGYRLAADSGVFTAQAVGALLPDGLAAVHVYPSLDSTNNKAKELAARDCPHGTAVFALTQTGGRGRYGRTFFSPPGGLYMSVVLRGAGLVGGSSPPTVTAAAAVAVCRAVGAVTGMEAQIKWINDVQVHGKKVCGILCEAVTGLESGGAEWVVVGMGVNLCREGIPEELRPVAAALYERDPGAGMRARLAAEILQNLLPEPPSGEPLLNEYRRRLSTLGREVTVHAPDGVYEAVAEGLDEQFRLVVRLPDGSRRPLSSGEVSVKQ